MNFAGGKLPYPDRIDEDLGLYSATFFEPGSKGYARAIPFAELDSIRLWQGYGDFVSYINDIPRVFPLSRVRAP